MTSKIKVDNINKVSDDSNIINKCGTTITLGASGDSINLAAGASQSGFGRTGTVDWITTPKVTGDSPVTVVSGKGYFLNTTAGTITINLPAGSAGDIVSLADYAATWQTYEVTVSPNGTDKIGSLNEDATLNTEGQSVTFVYVDGVQGWINTMDSTSNVRGGSFICASVSGACNTLTTAPDCSNMKVATFLAPGTFTVNSISACAANNLVSHLVVAGGGSGGGPIGGGGGGGGFREVNSPSAPYSASPLDGYPTPANRVTVSATAYPIQVGGGGPAVGAGSPVSGTAGTPSIFSITSAGGAGGAGNTLTGLNGGSGSGAGATASGGTGNTPPVSPAQGKDGGNGGGTNSNPVGAGGGGGATAAGGNGSYPSATGNCGGAGATTSISGSPTAYAGGGGGGNQSGTPQPQGGVGGGGNGAMCTTNPGMDGTANTGGGGGGAITGCKGSGGGGSGIVIIRYRSQ